MNVSTLNSAGAITLALAAALALGGCNKKTDDTKTSTGSGMGSSSGTTGSTSGSSTGGMPPASAPKP